PVIAGRLETSSAEPPGDLLPTARLDRDPRAHAITVRFLALETKRHEVPSCPLGSVVEVDERAVLRYHQGVDTSIVVEITNRQPSGHVQLLKRRAGSRCDLGQTSVLATHIELRRHRERIVRAQVADVAVSGQQVETAIIIGIQKRSAKAQDVAAWGR